MNITSEDRQWGNRTLLTYPRYLGLTFEPHIHLYLSPQSYNLLPEKLHLDPGCCEAYPSSRSTARTRQNSPKPGPNLKDLDRIPDHPHPSHSRPVGLPDLKPRIQSRISTASIPSRLRLILKNHDTTILPHLLQKHTLDIISPKPTKHHNKTSHLTNPQILIRRLPHRHYPLNPRDNSPLLDLLLSS
jgi:hypothetical protein